PDTQRRSFPAEYLEIEFGAERSDDRFVRPQYAGDKYCSGVAKCVAWQARVVFVDDICADVKIAQARQASLSRVDAARAGEIVLNNVPAFDEPRAAYLPVPHHQLIASVTDQGLEGKIGEKNA